MTSRQDTDRVTWLGHATVLLEVGGARLLTDPVLRRRILHLHRVVPVPAPPRDLDAILVSHLHHDHLDRATLQRIGGSAPLVVPRGALRSPSVRGLGRDVVELAAGEDVTVGGIRVEAVPAEHHGGRTPLTADVPALGFVAERVYFAGDTDLFDGMRALAGRVDVALLPVSGWGPKVGPGHMNPDRAARAAALIGPAVAIPIHWGTYRRYLLAERDGATPGDRFATLLAEHAPGVRAAVLDPGASLTLNRVRR